MAPHRIRWLSLCLLVHPACADDARPPDDSGAGDVADTLADSATTAPSDTSVDADVATDATVAPDATDATVAPDVADTADTTDPVDATDTTVAPDVPSIAPPLSPTEALDFGARSAFLYEGPDAPQQGVAPDAIDPSRLAVLRGEVFDRDGAPLEGARVVVFDHPEYGYTLTRADGGYALAVSGGGALALSVTKDGYLRVDRQVAVPWLDFVSVPEVRLTALDSKVTTVDLDADEVAVARANTVSDDDGERTATTVFKPGTTAVMRLPDGSTQPLTTLSIRMTEYTSGTGGPAAMPALLPTASAYTYALEYSVDEALAAGAEGVEFDRPVIHYSENFLGFAAGSAVPVGFYDRALGRWMPSENGRVVAIVGIDGGLAQVDGDGDGAADDAAGLAALGIDDDERAQLATLYQAGATLWRVPLRHFSAYDYNWPWSYPDGSSPPNGRRAKPGDKSSKDDRDCKSGGSIIQPERQLLGEVIDLAGTPLTLHYTTRRMPGYAINRHLDIPLIGATVPPQLQGVQVTVDIEGQRHTARLAPQANLVYPYTWDGNDAFGRALTGRHWARVSVGFNYPRHYRTVPPWVLAAFASAGNCPPNVTCTVIGLELEPPARLDADGLYLNFGDHLTQRYDVELTASTSPDSDQLGGWSVDVHHAWDAGSKTLYLGDGSQRSSDARGMVVNTIAGIRGNNGVAFYDPAVEGAAAADLMLWDVWDLELAPDGNVYLVSGNMNGVVVIDRERKTHVVAGGVTQGFSGDGGPAVAAELDHPRSIALAPDGSMYIGDNNNCRIRRVSKDGIITTVAGFGCVATTEQKDPWYGHGGPGTGVYLGSAIGDLAVGPDYSVYFGDYQSKTLRRLDPAGNLTIIAGPGTFPDRKEGGRALDAWVGQVKDVAVGPDGSVYFSGEAAIRRITPDGIVTTIAGTGTRGTGPDGVPARESPIYGLDFSIGRDGTLLIADQSRLREVGPDGIIRTLGGTAQEGFSGDGGYVSTARFDELAAPARLPDGTVLMIMEKSFLMRLVRLAPATASLADGEVLVPSDDGSEVFVFDAGGRHLRTLDAFTQAVRWRFGYDAAGRLTSVSDVYANVTTIARDTDGAATSIVGPYGHTTALEHDAAGWLARAAGPRGTHTMSYDAGGLLTGLTDARGAHAFTYDNGGRLVRDEGPGGVVTTLARSERDDGYTVTATSALGHTTSYDSTELGSGATRLTVTDASGATLVSESQGDGAQTISAPDGTVITTVQAPDPRFGALVPMTTSLTLTQPSGLTNTVALQRDITYTDPEDVLALATVTQTQTVDQHVTTRVYDAATRTTTTTTPEGRVIRATVNAAGDTTELVGAGAAPTTFAYDASGRLTGITRGGATRAYGYDAKGRVTSVGLPGEREASLGYDAADRLSALTLPGGAAWTFAYDGVARRSTIAGPGGASHVLDWSPLGLLSGYTPPGAGTSYAWTRDADRRLVTSALPGGRVITARWDEDARAAGYGYAEADVAIAFGDLARTPSTLTWTPASGAAQSLAWSHDGGLLTGQSVSGPASGAFTYSYGSDFLMDHATLTSGDDVRSIALEHDADGLVIAEGPFTFERAPASGVVTEVSDGTLVIASEHDALGRLQSRSHTVAGVEVFTLALTWDDAGRVITEVRTVLGDSVELTYAYDDDGNLVVVSRDGVVVEEYGYDARWNRTSRTLGAAASETSTFRSDDRITAHGALAYTTDVDGFVSARGATERFGYSARGELLSATTAAGATLTYSYDALARQVARTSASGTTQLFYGHPEESFQVTHVRDEAGVLTSLFYDQDGFVIALERDGARYYVATDQVGTPVVVTDAAGAAVKILDHDAFGKVTVDSAPGFALPIGFAGGLADAGTGLVRMGWRDYDPVAGRFTSRDPALLTAGEANVYRYAGNDPTSRRDPSGLLTMGGSLYTGLGGGGKITVTADGMSVCFEVGVGAGASFDMAPFDTVLDGDTEKLKLEGKAGYGPLSLSGGFSIDHCGKIKPKWKGKNTDGLPVGYDSSDGAILDYKELLHDAVPKTPKLKIKGVELQGKLVLEVCRQASWDGISRAAGDLYDFVTGQ